MIMDHKWLGNIGELKQALETACHTMRIRASEILETRDFRNTMIDDRQMESEATGQTLQSENAFFRSRFMASSPERSSMTVAKALDVAYRPELACPADNQCQKVRRRIVTPAQLIQFAYWICNADFLYGAGSYSVPDEESIRARTREWETTYGPLPLLHAPSPNDHLLISTAWRPSELRSSLQVNTTPDGPHPSAPSWPVRNHGRT